MYYKTEFHSILYTVRHALTTFYDFSVKKYNTACSMGYVQCDSRSYWKMAAISPKFCFIVENRLKNI